MTQKLWASALIIFSLFSAAAFGAETNGSVSSTVAVKPHMQDFFDSISKLQPYIVNKDEYLNEKNSEKVLNLVGDFKDKTIALKKEKLAQSADMKFRAQQLAEGLNEAYATYKDGFRDYSYWVLKSNLNQCFSCHTQKGLDKTQFKIEQMDKEPAFAQAEFLFLVRNYDQSIALYKKIIENYPQNKESVENVEVSLQKILYYYVRVLREDSQTEKTFEDLSKNKALPEYIHHSLSAWKNYLKIKKYRVVENSKIKNVQSLEKFIKEREDVASHYTFSRQRTIVDLETSQVLFKLLEKNEIKNLKPWLLYYLAMTEIGYRTTMFDSTPELYLKECIESYSKTKAAPKCLDLFKQMKKEAYTGSRGTDIPKNVQEQIKKYENMISK